MSIRAMNAVWDYSNSRSGDRLLMIALGDIADDGGYAFPSVARLASKCNVTERAIHDGLKRLEDAAELVIDHRSGRGRTNRYWIRLPGIKPEDSPRFREEGRDWPVKGEVERSVKGEAHDGKGEVARREKVKPTSREPSLEPSEPKTVESTNPKTGKPRTRLRVVHRQPRECPHGSLWCNGVSPICDRCAREVAR